jgi:3-hydroxyisobutyrate dehydrogenase
MMGKTIGFIGLGHMGGPMAQNLIKAGHSLKVFDLVPEALQAAVKAGATAVESAAQAVAGVDVVITMLPASRHVEGLYLGDAGLLRTIAKGTLVLECSTIAPESARKVSRAAAQLGIPMIDAPVSGGTGGAVAGTLTFIVGGAAADLEAAMPYLQAMGKKHLPCRRGRSRAGRQNLQQHAPGNPDGRHCRNTGTWRRQWA